MTRSMGRRLSVVLAAWMVAAGTSASAQVIGTFRWQLVPHCNVVTFRVEQKGTVFQLAGTDDQCGGSALAAANGSAHVNPNGTVGLALTVHRPDGLTIATTVTLSLATLSGTWSDEYAGAGTFQFNPGPTSGLPRRITLTGVFSLAYSPTNANQAGISSFSFGRLLSFEPQAPAANFIQKNGLATANCPASSANPQAAPGHLCIYEVQNATLLSKLAPHPFDERSRVIMKRGTVARGAGTEVGCALVRSARKLV